ncbi:cytochrome c oxidase subunit II [Roseomonas sp. NAR14]|uniref:cytochrome-c oxidase n=1 Tax=Roseomonas acroporae TaxID=2937791 RepID=A0A9X2BZJ0_9PROT|nr:cytochrome c oxidase subunit II [Roseomonas acroporae]MCK8787080.1 cytochrome c oxidase subunit II [Roseomonas acroporae]
MSGLSGWVPLWPPAASAEAGTVDAIVLLLLGLSGAVLLLVLCLVAGFAIRYRRGSPAKRGALPELVQSEVEIGWTAATLLLALLLFAWAASAQLGEERTQSDALEIHVTARQWMWKAQHPNGAREINALHLPRGEPVRLLMTSEDVIHSFFVPAFRIKQDVLPGRVTQLRFHPTETGEFHLFCAEFCGTLHARMLGTVTVMEPGDYARWRAAQPEGDGLAREGAALFVSLGCAGCHGAGGGGSEVGVGATVRAPRLAGLYGRDVPLADGRVVRADEAYLRDSILQPGRDVAAGYAPLMPSFAGLLGEGEVQRLVAYLRERGEQPGEGR